jgi:predicted component of type VI protein secretion system
MRVFLDPADPKGLRIPLDKAIVFIGRHPDCDVIITRSRMISRKHCAIVQVDDTLVIRDLGSTNGVRVNGGKVHNESRFNVGDTVTIGDLDYVVTQVKAPEPEPRPRRDHPQDAREAGAIAVPSDHAAKAAAVSQDFAVAIPENNASFGGDSIDAVTPDSYSVAPKKRGADRGRPERSNPKGRRYSDSDSHFPVAE